MHYQNKHSATQQKKERPLLNYDILVLVRSKLEYCSYIWYPLYDRFVKDIEGIQRRFFKYLTLKCDRMYASQGIEQNKLLFVNSFQAEFLQTKRIAGLLVFMHKLLMSNLLCAESASRAVPTPYFDRGKINLANKSGVDVMCNNVNFF